MAVYGGSRVSESFELGADFTLLYINLNSRFRGYQTIAMKANTIDANMPSTNKKSANFSEKNKMPHKPTEDELDLLKKRGYSNKVIQLYVSRVNIKEMENADVAFAYTGPCGDTIEMFIISKERRVDLPTDFAHLI